MPQDIPATCNGCGKRFSIQHTLSRPKGSLVLACHDDAAKEWDTFGAWAVIPRDITYEPKINSRTVQGGEDPGQSAAGEWKIRRLHGNS